MSSLPAVVLQAVVPVPPAGTPVAGLVVDSPFFAHDSMISATAADQED